MRTLLLITLVLLVGVGGCKKDELVCSYDKEFCQPLAENNLNGVDLIVQEFLNTLHYERKRKGDNSIVPGYNDERMRDNFQLFLDWLRCKSCITEVQGGYTESLPPAAQVWISVDSASTQITKVMYLRLGVPFHYQGFDD